MSVHDNQIWQEYKVIKGDTIQCIEVTHVDLSGFCRSWFDGLPVYLSMMQVP